MKRLLASLCILLALAACSKEKPAIRNDARTPYQSVNVNTPGVTGVSCVVQSGRDTYTVQAPGAVMVRRSPEPMIVHCFKGEYMRGQASVRPSYAPGEGDAVRGTQASCMSCSYPGTVTVALALDRNAMNVPYYVWPQK